MPATLPIPTAAPTNGGRDQNDAKADDLTALRSPAGHWPAAKVKSTSAWQDALWQRWPREECWPAKMDVYEAAAYLRVSPDTIRRAMVVARDGRARLAHQRVGSVYRIRKTDLDTYGLIPARSGGYSRPG